MSIVTLFSLNLTLFLGYYIQDPDPHSPKKLDPDPHKVNADPKRCLTDWAQADPTWSIINIRRYQ
jgi:hypothetical protein